MKIGIIDSRSNCYVTDPGIEQAIFDGVGEVTLIRVDSTDDLPSAAFRCDGLISWHLVPLCRHFLQDLRHCKGIVRAAVGFDNIDLAAAAERGIQIANVPDYGTEEVADHAVALALSLLRRLLRCHRVVTGGSWDWREAGKLPRLSQMRIGIIGFGRIGIAAALRFKAFGCQVAFYDPLVSSGVEKSLGVNRYDSLDDLLNGTELVSLHAPLDETTRHMIGAHELDLLKGKYLVNTARGGLIDGVALCRALEGEQLCGVGLDVYEDERHVIPNAFQNHDNVILSPHVAFYSEAALLELRRKAASVLRDILKNGGHRNVIRQ